MRISDWSSDVYSSDLPVRMGDHPAPRGEDQVDGTERAIGVGRLARGLAGREDRHRDARLVGENRIETGARRRDDALVAFAEFVPDAVHVQVVDPGEPPGQIGSEAGRERVWQYV